VRAAVHTSLHFANDVKEHAPHEQEPLALKLMFYGDVARVAGAPFEAANRSEQEAGISLGFQDSQALFSKKCNICIFNDLFRRKGG
jgi:hypothetical protein